MTMASDMRCDLVAVGTELLLGQIVDSNSAWIGEQLAANGIATNVHVKVGDNVARIERVLRQRLAEADAVIVCGGLGPTHDDLTREAIAAVMGGVGPRARRVGRRRDRRAVRRTGSGDEREQPAPGDGAGGRHGDPAAARDRAGVDLPGHGRRRRRR